MSRPFFAAIALLSLSVFLAFSEPPSRERAVVQGEEYRPAPAFLPERTNAGAGESKNLLILGRAGNGWAAGDLTDTIILAVIEPDGDDATARLSLISIPRDLLVQLPGGGTTKINALWTIGKQGDASNDEVGGLIRDAVEEIVGIPIADTLVVDVSAVEQTIDALGGIALNVEERIDDPAFPTPGGGTERFTIEPGFRVLDGATAVRYARTRHTPEGDFGRVRRQHQVLEAILAKSRGLNVASDFPKILEIYRMLTGHVETTLSIEEILRLALSAHNAPLAGIRTFALETIGREPLLMSAGNASLVPRAGMFQYAEIRKVVSELLKTHAVDGTVGK